MGTRTTAHVALATVDGDESPQQGGRIDPIGLHSAGPAIDLDAWRIEDAAVDPDLSQRTCQPETVVTRLITHHDPPLLPRSLAQSADQISQIAAGDPVNARPISIRMSDAHDPTLLAELDRCINCRLEPDTIVHAGHRCRSPELVDKGRWMDNIFVERLWRSLKYEEVYLHAYATVAEARTGIGACLDFYNTERQHQSLGYRTPRQIYQEGLWICGRSALPTGCTSPASRASSESGEMLAFAHIPTGTAANHGFDIDEVNRRLLKPAVAPTAIGADTKTGRLTP